VTLRRFVVTLGDNSTATVDAEVFAVDDGVLTFLADEAPGPDEIVARSPIFSVARGAWKTVEAYGAGVSFSSPGWGGHAAAEPARPPRVLPATPQPDTMRQGW
jgi:hypothetical protein